MDRRLPDTPWHLGYAKKDEDDPRRHKARCIHNNNGICTSSRSNYCKETCGGSSHCEEYSESREEYEKLLESRKTIEEISRDNREKYREIIKKKKKEFVNEPNPHSYQSTEKIHRCLLCDEGLSKIKYSLKKCKFCGMYYVNVQDFQKSDVIEEIGSNEVFVMNIPQKNENTANEKYYTCICICKHADKRSNCQCVNAKFYTKKCKKRQCEYYERRQLDNF